RRHRTGQCYRLCLVLLGQGAPRACQATAHFVEGRRRGAERWRRRRPRHPRLLAEGRTVSERQRLPDRRVSTSFDFVIGTLRYTCSFSRFANGRLAEVFLQNHKPGSQSDSYARDAAIAASLALQHGCSLDVLRRALLRDAQGNASTPLGAALDIIAEQESGR